MDVSLNKDDRIEIRVPSHLKQLFKKAQELSGDKSFSSFIIRILKQQSEEIIERKERVLISERDRNIFFDAIFNEKAPNSALIEAAKKYKSKFNSL